MADKGLKSIIFPGLPDRYQIPQIDPALESADAAAPADVVGQAVSDIGDLTTLQTTAKTDLVAAINELYTMINGG